MRHALVHVVTIAALSRFHHRVCRRGNWALPKGPVTCPRCAGERNKPHLVTSFLKLYGRCPRPNVEYILNSFAGTPQKHGPQLQLGHMAASATHTRAPAETKVPGDVLGGVISSLPDFAFAFCPPHVQGGARPSALGEATDHR